VAAIKRLAAQIGINSLAKISGGWRAIGVWRRQAAVAARRRHQSGGGEIAPAAHRYRRRRGDGYHGMRPARRGESGGGVSIKCGCSWRRISCISKNIVSVENQQAIGGNNRGSA